ncbi:hypothetical protein IAI10_16135 [Clostridium sp. 19966]|uniref:hypothetical protein n=1 Tax=Clostridium sp. 19966 TaxID=2768166 RepID=UPI0028DDA2DF|nr:hypothetical protein [Clostridium sp. 19966]MDT8718196.1 hypothetical protein [Clostridium sp. 19966]
MYSMYVNASRVELDNDVDSYNDKLEEIYYLQNDDVFIILRLLDIWYKDLNIEGGKLITLEHFLKAKISFNDNKNIIQEYVEEDVIYRTEHIQEFFDYVENYIDKNEIKCLYIETDYFS